MMCFIINFTAKHIIINTLVQPLVLTTSAVWTKYCKPSQSHTQQEMITKHQYKIHH